MIRKSQKYLSSKVMVSLFSQQWIIRGQMRYYVMCMRHTDCQWDIRIIVQCESIISHTRLPKRNDLDILKAIIRL